MAQELPRKCAHTVLQEELTDTPSFNRLSVLRKHMRWTKLIEKRESASRAFQSWFTNPKYAASDARVDSYDASVDSQYWSTHLSVQHRATWRALLRRITVVSCTVANHLVVSNVPNSRTHCEFFIAVKEDVNTDADTSNNDTNNKDTSNNDDSNEHADLHVGIRVAGGHGGGGASFADIAWYDAAVAGDEYVHIKFEHEDADGRSSNAYVDVTIDGEQVIDYWSYKSPADVAEDGPNSLLARAKVDAVLSRLGLDDDGGNGASSNTTKRVHTFQFLTFVSILAEASMPWDQWPYEDDGADYGLSAGLQLCPDNLLYKLGVTDDCDDDERL